MRRGSWRRRLGATRPGEPPPYEFEVSDDRDTLQAGDRVLLIIEDDVRFAEILLDRAHGMGFKGIVALDGETGLRLAKRFKPQAITWILNLPKIDGWAVLDQLKYDLSTTTYPGSYPFCRGRPAREASNKGHWPF